MSNSEIRLERFVGGPLLTACYVLIAPGSESLIVDAPRKAWESALHAAEDADAPVKLVFATHGHWDHIAGASELRSTGLPLAGHPADRKLFRDPMEQRADLPFVVPPVEIDRELADAERIAVGDVEGQVLHTPGHTPGGVSLWFPELDLVFTGDTVLKGGAGYLDRPEADARALAASVRRIAGLPEQTRIYPGHGAPTTVGDETWLNEDSEELIADWLAGRRRWTPRPAKR